MLEISRPIIVEGKYDKIKLNSLVKANIITTDGFGIFNAKEKAKLIRRLAAERGIIVITDSDGAGLVIRNFLRNLVPKDKITHIYIPQIKGKERRKDTPSKEGFLGVEGMEADFLRKALAPFADGELKPRMTLTKTDLYELGLSGGADSALRREKLSKALDLPQNLSANALLEAICMLVSEEEFKIAYQSISEE